MKANRHPILVALCWFHFGMSLSLLISTTLGRDTAPIRTGRELRLRERSEQALLYKVGVSGWTDDLTELHENTVDERSSVKVASQERAFCSLPMGFNA